jgi:hypothetical protein
MVTSVIIWILIGFNKRSILHLVLLCLVRLLTHCVASGHQSIWIFLFAHQFRWMWFLVSQSGFVSATLDFFPTWGFGPVMSTVCLLSLARLPASSLPPGSSCSQFFVPRVKIWFYRLFFFSSPVLPLDCARSDSGSSYRRPQLFSLPRFWFCLALVLFFAALLVGRALFLLARRARTVFPREVFRASVYSAPIPFSVRERGPVDLVVSCSGNSWSTLVSHWIDSLSCNQVSLLAPVFDFAVWKSCSVSISWHCCLGKFIDFFDCVWIVVRKTRYCFWVIGLKDSSFTNLD